MSKSEQREDYAKIPLRLLRHLPTPIFMLDGRGKITFCNDALVELTGYLREELLGAGLDALTDREGIQAALMDTLALYEGKDLLQHQYDILRKSGTKIRAAIDITPIYGEDEKSELVMNALGIVMGTEPLG